MTMFQGILLGILQGVAEFIPISSSGHLVVFKDLLGVGEVPLLFDILLHIATLLVVVVFFRKKIALIWNGLFKKEKSPEEIKARSWVVPLVIGSIPTALLGLGIKSMELDQNVLLVSILFFITALILLIPRMIPATQIVKPVNPLIGFIVGFSQGIAVLPGISRSGMTISTGRLAGLNAQEAGEFSFLLSIPAILGALALDFRHFGELQKLVNWPVLLVSFLVTMVVGWFSLLALIKVLRSKKLYYFSIYLVIIGVLSLFFFQ